jgi:anti-anti-sigma factor
VSRDAGGRVLIVLSGEIDMTGADALQQVLLGAVRTARTVDVRIEDLSFIDSTVITSLINANNAATSAGCSFVLRQPTPQVRRVLEVAGVLKALTHG